MYKKLFQSKEKSPQIGVEIIGAKLAYSRCEFETCEISFTSTDDNNNASEHQPDHSLSSQDSSSLTSSASTTTTTISTTRQHTSIAYSHLVGDTCCWIFRENIEFSIDAKVTFIVSICITLYQVEILIM